MNSQIHIQQVLRIFIRDFLRRPLPEADTPAKNPLNEYQNSLCQTASDPENQLETDGQTQGRAA